MSTPWFSALRHPQAWRLAAEGMFQHFWFLVAPAAAAYRKTLLRKSRVVAVVGSFGKTTTARAIRRVLGVEESRLDRRNSWSFVAAHLLVARPSTKRLVVEVGIDGPGQMARYAAVLRPDITVVTSVGTEHGRSLKTLENTRAEKAAMVAALPPSGLAILNGDDPCAVWMRERTRARSLLVGRGESSDLRATQIRDGKPEGMEFLLELQGKQTPMSTRLIGQHQLNAVLSAVAIGLEEGLEMETIRERIAALEPTPGRLEIVALDNGAHLLRDDFKAAYETVLAALATFASLPAQRKIVVIGDISEPPGIQGVIYREVGAKIAEVAEICFVVSNAVTLQRYQSGARQAGRLSCSFQSHGRNVLDTIAALQETIRPGDLVLVKGRDTQRLERIAFALQGRRVRCCRVCDLNAMSCQDCPLL